MKRFMSKRFLSLFLASMLLFSLSATTSLALPKGDFSIRIIHVNDRHGRMTADPYIVPLAEGALLLDAGDAIHGQISSNLTGGEAMIELMNAVGYNAMAVGNHEFDFGREQLMKLRQKMKFPLLAANIKDETGKLPFEPYKIFNVKGVSVGVFGLATPETVTTADPRKVKGLTFEKPLVAATEMVKVLKAKGCDVIVALVHLGLDGLSLPTNRSSALAAVPGIDVVIDGHSHTLLPLGLVIGNTLIAQTGEHGKNIGIVTLEFSDGKLRDKRAELVQVPQKDAKSDDVTPPLAKDEKIAAVIDKIELATKEQTRTLITTTPVPLLAERPEVRFSSSNLADMITDSMRNIASSDIAFMTGGNIRASIKEGEISIGDVLTTLPFSNTVTRVDLSGNDVLAMLEHGVKGYPEPVGSYIHVSGIKVTFDPALAPGRRVKSAVLLDGRQIQPDKTYSVATIDFLIAGGDGYSMMKNGKNTAYFGGDADCFIDYLKAKPVFKVEPEERVAPIIK